MARNNTFFYISGLISLSLFSLFLLMFFTMLFKQSKIDTFALKKDNYISISLDIPILEPKKHKITKRKKKKIKHKPLMSSVISEASEEVDINDLFSDVWTKKIVRKKQKKRDNKRIKEIQKKIDKSEKNIVVPEDTLENDNELNVNNENNTTVTANEVNEYLAKIQALVYKYFHVPLNSQGHSVKAVIELNALGKMIDFRVLTYSNNEDLNREVDKIKDKLLGVVFPVNIQNKSTKTVVILTAKE